MSWDSGSRLSRRNSRSFRVARKPPLFIAGTMWNFPPSRIFTPSITEPSFGLGRERECPPPDQFTALRGRQDVRRVQGDDLSLSVLERFEIQIVHREVLVLERERELREDCRMESDAVRVPL